MTLFSEEQSTMVSTWTTEIICRSARGGACTLETNVTDPDLDEDQDDYFDFCSELIKTKEDFARTCRCRSPCTQPPPQAVAVLRLSC